MMHGPSSAVTVPSSARTSSAYSVASPNAVPTSNDTIATTVREGRSARPTHRLVSYCSSTSPSRLGSAFSTSAWSNFFAITLSS